MQAEDQGVHRKPPVGPSQQAAPSAAGQDESAIPLRVLVAGSRKEASDQQKHRFLETGRWLGRLLANRGATIIAGSQDDGCCLDPAVAMGAHGASSDRKTSLVLVRPANPDPNDSPDFNYFERTGLEVELIEVAGTWQNVAVRNRQVQEANVLIVLGGGEGTKLLIDIAVSTDKPVIAIGVHGGTARDEFRRCAAKLTNYGITHDECAGLETVCDGATINALLDKIGTAFEALQGPRLDHTKEDPGFGERLVNDLRHSQQKGKLQASQLVRLVIDCCRQLAPLRVADHYDFPFLEAAIAEADALVKEADRLAGKDEGRECAFRAVGHVVRGLTETVAPSQRLLTLVTTVADQILALPEIAMMVVWNGTRRENFYSAALWGPLEDIEALLAEPNED